MKSQIVTFDLLKERVETYITCGDDISLLTRAYTYANEAHFGQKRLTGEDYIDHPLNVAYILANINADIITICAALLHDVIEDCNVTKDEMKSIFGEEITILVDGVTKINRLNFVGANEAVIANHRKILVGLSEDVRVIIIKIADRLHNLKTLWVLPEKKQKEKAKETLDIIVPIAHRLGMNTMKGELEDLCLRYYKPDAYYTVVEKLNQSKAERDNNVVEMKNQIIELLNDHNIKHEIKGRSKSIYSIYKKLDTGRKFSDIYDLLALRIFVDNEQDCYQVLGLLHSKYKPIPKRFKDYIAMPKTNMYQSLHTTVFGVDGCLFEIQIRTYEMDKVAENGIASHWSYKEQGGSNKANLQNAMEQKLQFFRSLIELKDEDQTDETFVNSVKEDIFKNTIYVFTPKGDVIELPSGSTPIDFAYRVHSSVGDKMVGAIVNSSIVPLDYELQSNDIIKINTNKNSVGPSKEWISIAKTNQAKNKIKAFFNKNSKEEYLKIGEDLLNKEVKRKKIILSDFFTNENMDRIVEELKLQNIEELYVNIGNNKLPVNHVVNVIFPTNSDSKEEIILKKTQNKEVILPTIKNDIIVEGIDDIKVNVAACCKPIPGDRIVGYITKGYGITVHRMVCPNVSELEERIIDVNWNSNITKKYPTSILVHSLEGKNILLEIIAKTANNDIVIQSINTNENSDNYMYDLTVLVENKEKLIKFMNEIYSIQNIIDVDRIIK